MRYDAFAIYAGDCQKCSSLDFETCNFAENYVALNKRTLSHTHGWKEKKNHASKDGSKEKIQVLAKEEFAELQEGNGYKLISTVKCMRWALNNFEA